MPPEYPTETHEKKSKKKIVLLLAAFTVLVSGTTAFGLLYYKTKMNSDEELANKQKTIDELEGRNANYLKQIDSLKKTDDKETDEVIADNSFREIPELGVKYALNDQTNALTYSYMGGNNVWFSTIDLSNSSPGDSTTGKDDCLSSNGPGGSIAKMKSTDQFLGTTAEAAANSPERKDSFKKIGEFYFYYRGPDAPCSENAAIQAKASQALAVSKAAFESLQAIE